MRPHLNGCCTLCYKTKTGEIPKGSTLERLHRAIVVFGALPTPQNSRTLLEVLEGLRVYGDDAAPILTLLKEVLQYCYPQSTDRERIEAIEDEIRRILGFLPNKKAGSITKSKRPRLKHAIDLIHTVRKALITNMRIRSGLPEDREETEEPAQGPERVISLSLSPEPSRRESSTEDTQESEQITTPPSSPNPPGGNVTKKETTLVGGSTLGNVKQRTNKRKGRADARQPQDAAVIHQQKRERTSKRTKTGVMNVEREDDSAQRRTNRGVRVRIKSEEGPAQGQTAQGVRVAAMREESPVQEQTDGNAGFSLYGRRRRPRRLT